MKTLTKPKVMIAGADGQLGVSLTLHFQGEFDVVASSKTHLNISCSESIKKALKFHKPDYVVNCAAYTWVDGAEEQQEACYKVNEVGVCRLATACKEYDALLIHLSTDYVFDGQKEVPYIESDKPKPLNVYGKSKLSGEQAVARFCDRYIIVRTASLFSLEGNNFCRSILKMARNNKRIAVVDDQFSGPTFVDDLAKSIKKIIVDIEQKKTQFTGWGIYHYCGEPRVSWYDFALEVLQSQGYDAAKLNCSPIKLNKLNSKASRPRMTMLNNQKIQAVFSVKPSDWKSAIYQNKFKL
ncbi:dTDP-4-dehydrorhamnose reductase [Shewanella sp. OPT22]|nr:dTDP-4-dehydrorhamnose reductase [Shewanella sp. OPT22]